MIMRFHATWCGPCKMVAPVVKALSEEHGEILVDIDIDESPEITQTFGVMSVPTIVRVDDDGKEIARVVGAKPKVLLAKSLGL